MVMELDVYDLSNCILILQGLDSPTNIIIPFVFLSFLLLLILVNLTHLFLPLR
jgi:hypothetical protein